MGIKVTNFGNQRAVFANQDDGIFSAIPITFDESVLTLETYTAGSRKFVKAGSVVKYGSVVKGITAEEYEITDGPVNGRVVLEGYVYVEALTESAVEAMSSLPKIVPIPYGKIIFAAIRAAGLDVFLKVSGSVWASTVNTASFTVEDGDEATNLEIKAVEKHSEMENLIKITLGSKGGAITDGTLKITQIASAAVVGATGKAIGGLPIEIEVKNGEVCIDA